jgi:hypothetical protein
MAFVILVLIDLSIVPLAILWIFVGSIVASSSHTGSVLPSIVLAVVLAAALIGLTFVVGRAWRRAPLPKPIPPPN